MEGLLASLVALAGAEVREWLKQNGSAPHYTPIKPPIDPGCPCQNGYVESIHSRLRDELLNREAFASVQEARVQLETHRHWYNKERPHSSLKYLPPATFRQQWQTRKMDGLEERPPD